MLKYISAILLPSLILIVILYGIKKKINIYDVFIDGAKEGFEVSLATFPYLLGMMFAINLFLKSGFLNIALNFIEPITLLLKIPTEIIPLAIMRPISGSSSLAILTSIFESFGPDGTIGRIASIIQGSNDTTFYIITLYFGAVGIKKIRYALWGGLISDLISVIAGIIIVNFLF